MATTEEIVAKYRLDLDELKGQVKTLQTEFGKVDDTAKKSADSSEKAFGKLGDSLKNLGKAVLAAFAVEKIIAFGKASVEAYAEAEKGALKLKSAVTANGGLLKDFQTLTAQAEELADLTIFDDDTIKAAQTLALQFGLNSSAVERLIPRVADFAAATGQELEPALQAVLGGINGQVDGLKRYGFELDTSATKNERFADVLDTLNQKFSGQARTLKDTLSGSIGEAEQAYDELKETIGGALAPLVTNLATGLTSVFNAFKEAPIDGLRAEQRELKATTTEVLGLAVGTEQRTEAVRILQEKYPEYLGNLNAEKASNDQLREAMAKVNDQLTFKIAQTELQNKLAPIQERAGKAAAEEAEARQQLADALTLIYDRSRAYNKESNNQAIKNLEDAGIQAAAFQLLQGKVKLYAIASVSLTEVSEAYDKVNKATGESIKADEELAEASRETSKEVEQLRQLLGIPVEPAQPKTTGLEKLTEAEKAAAAAAAKAAKERRDKAIQESIKQLEEEAKIREELRKGEFAQDEENLKLYNQEQLRILGERYVKEAELAQKNAIAAQAENLDNLQRGLITYEEYEKRKQKIADSIPDPTKQKEREKLLLELQTLELSRQNRLDYGEDVRKIDQDILDKKAELVAADIGLEQDAAARRLAIAEKDAKDKEELLKKEAEQRKANLEKTVELAQSISDQLVALYNQEAEERVKVLEQQRTEELGAADTRQQELDEQLAKRLLSQEEYQKASDAVAAQRLTTEKTIGEEIKKLKKREDLAAKAQALFRISIDTARAIQAQLAATPLPAGALFLAAIAASGLLQAGTVLAAKPPQYAKGVNWVPLNGHRRGRDTVPAMLDEGERVISRRKNLDNWDLYQAIDHGRLDQYIFKRYTLPALQAERAKGGPVVHALGQLLAAGPAADRQLDPQELRRLFRRGLPITNLDELAALLASRQSSPFRA